MPATRRVRYRPFRIPFRREFRAAFGTMEAREGFVVQVEDVEGNVGLGEALPLTAFTGETLEDDARFFEAWLNGLNPARQVEPMPESGGWAAVPPAAAAAIECALLDISANRAGRVLARYIARATGTPGPARAPVPVNAVLPIGEPAAVAEAARGLHEEGFRTFKLKAGPDLDTNAATVRAVREALGPEVNIRLDANGAWTEQEAVRQLAALRGFDLDLVEQPVPPGEDAISAMGRIRDATGVAVAADESLVNVVDIGSVLPGVDAVVLKPAIHGAGATHEYLWAAAKAGKRAIVTTTFDTGIGTALALHLAALIPEPRPACGLDTVRFLEGDIVTGVPAIVAGRVALSNRSGLGVKLDEAALDHFATGPWREARP